MRISITAALATLLGASVPLCAQPRSIDLTGAWSGQRPGQGGMDHITDSYQPDGSFVSVLQLPNGTVQRLWGHYQATPTAPNAGRVDFQVEGHLPLQICAQAPGFPVNCRPNQVQGSATANITMTSPSSFMVNGIVMSRDPAPYLLQQRVPEQLVLAARAPVQPQMQQPVMPTLHPYQTPNGPGQAIANANHAGAQNFINGNMRGCYTGSDGRLYGCQQ